MAPSVYRPYGPARRPGSSPESQPPYRVLVHRKMAERWDGLAERVGLEAAQQFYDHVSQTPGQQPTVGSTAILKGKAGKPSAPGFSRTYHYEISGAGRINYQFNNEYTGGGAGDSHAVVRIVNIALGSH